MTDHNITPRYKPSEPPRLPSRATRGPEDRLKRPYAACWVSESGAAVLGFHHLYKSAVAHCRASMNDGCALPINHHTRFYVWDTSREPWNPDDIQCWIPVADFPRNQYVLQR